MLTSGERSTQLIQSNSQEKAENGGVERSLTWGGEENLQDP